MNDDLDGDLRSLKKRLEAQFASRVDKEFPKDKKFTAEEEQRKKEWFKSKKEKEAQNRKDVMLELRRFVFGRVETEFGKFKGEADPSGGGEEWLNPWDRSLRDTMFWM